MSDFVQQKLLMLAAAHKAAGVLREEFEKWYQHDITAPQADGEIEKLAAFLRRPGMKEKYRGNITMIEEDFIHALQKAKSEAELFTAQRRYINDRIRTGLDEEPFFSIPLFASIFYGRFVREYSESAIDASEARPTNIQVASFGGRVAKEAGFHTATAYREDIVQQLGALKAYFDEGLKVKEAVHVLLPLYGGGGISPYITASTQLAVSESGKGSAGAREGSEEFHALACEKAKDVTGELLKKFFDPMPTPASPHMFNLALKSYRLAERSMRKTHPGLAPGSPEYLAGALEIARFSLSRLVKDYAGMGTDIEVYRRASQRLDQMSARGNAKG